MTKTMINQKKTMRCGSYKRLLAVLAASLVTGWVGHALAASIPTNQVNMIPAGLVNYQGTLLTPTGTAYTNGIYDIQFRLYPESSSGTNKALWGAGYKVFVKDGIFGVMLGQLGGADLNDSTNEFKATELWKALWYDETSPVLNLYLGITVKQDQNRNPISSPAEAVPRQQFLVTPFAARAQQAMYARRSSGDFDVGGYLRVSNSLTIGGSLTVTNILGGSLTSTAITGATISATSLSSTTITGATISATSLSSTTITGATISATSFKGSGTNLTGVALLSANNTFSGLNTFGPVQTFQGATFNTDIVVKGNVKLGPSGTSYAPSGEENLRILRGCVNESGSVSGTGFTSSVAGALFTVTFTQPFSGIPTVVATPLYSDGHGRCAEIYEVASDHVKIRTFYADSGDNESQQFYFIAIGPR